MEDHMTTTCQWRLVYCTDCNEQFAKCDEDVGIKRFYYNYVPLYHFDSKRRLSSHSFQFCLVLSTSSQAFAHENGQEMSRERDYFRCQISP